MQLKEVDSLNSHDNKTFSDSVKYSVFKYCFGLRPYSPLSLISSYFSGAYHFGIKELYSNEKKKEKKSVSSDLNCAIDIESSNGGHMIAVYTDDSELWKYQKLRK